MSFNAPAIRSIRARAPIASSPQVRAVMKANYGGGLLPEQILRSELQKAGLRFRKHVKPLPGVRCEADIVFSRAKLCVFVDGCFWHGCPRHFVCPKTNSAWWDEKIKENRIRDRLRNKQSPSSWMDGFESLGASNPRRCQRNSLQDPGAHPPLVPAATRM